MEETIKLTSAKVKIYKSGIIRRRWRWKITSSNGRIIAASSQSFSRKETCEDNLNILYHQLRELYKA